jgi:hypothetical protein
MKTKIRISTILLGFMIALPLCAQAGVNSGGGGDTDAVQFLGLALETGYWINNSARPELKGAQFNKFVADLASNLDGKEKARLIFDYKAGAKTIERDPFGVPKIAIFKTSDQSIHVDRNMWRVLSLKDKYEVVSLEIFGLLGVHERYVVAGDVSSHYQEMTQANYYEISRALNDLAALKNKPHQVPIVVSTSVSISHVLDAVGLSFINKQAESQVLRSDRSADLPKLAYLLSLPRYSCQAKILLDLHRLVLEHPEKVMKAAGFVEQSYLQSLALQEQGMKDNEKRGIWHPEDEAREIQYLRAKPAISEIGFAIDTQFQNQVSEFLKRWQTSSPADRSKQESSFKLDVYREPAKGACLNRQCYSIARVYGSYDQDRLTGKLTSMGTPFHWDFARGDFNYDQYVAALVRAGSMSEDEAAEASPLCSLNVKQFSYVMGVRGENVTQGFRP